MPDMEPPRKPPEAPVCARANPAPAARPEAIESSVLLGPAQELLIRHGGRIYRLRRTRLGKLILTA